MNTDKYVHFNHHQELTDEHEFVDFGDGEFIANKDAIPLLKALNEIGLRTRTHNVTKDKCYLGIFLDPDMKFEIEQVDEEYATRERYNGRTELVIRWDRTKE